MHRLNDLLLFFEQEFSRELTLLSATEPANLYEPVIYSLKTGGKRIRPVLLLHTASLFTDSILKILPAAFAIEIFHNFTLLHDDFMDHASVRRGNPTVHLKYGVNSSILSGDVMSILSFEKLTQCDPAMLSEILVLFAKTAKEVCEGQQYDMEFEQKVEVSVADYIEMIKLKTAVLIAASLKIGAILGGADKESANLLYDFGIMSGIAFQLQDDWLDVYGEEKSFGKKIGGDICENKKTFLFIKALEIGDTVTKNSLKNLFHENESDPDWKVREVTKIFSDTGAGDATRIMMKHYYDEAMVCLSKLNIKEEDKDELASFASKVLSRNI